MLYQCHPNLSNCVCELRTCEDDVSNLHSASLSADNLRLIYWYGHLNTMEYHASRSLSQKIGYIYIYIYTRKIVWVDASVASQPGLSFLNKTVSPYLRSFPHWLMATAGCLSQGRPAGGCIATQWALLTAIIICGNCIQTTDSPRMLTGCLPASFALQDLQKIKLYSTYVC